MWFYKKIMYRKRTQNAILNIQFISNLVLCYKIKGLSKQIRYVIITYYYNKCVNFILFAYLKLLAILSSFDSMLLQQQKASVYYFHLYALTNSCGESRFYQNALIKYYNKLIFPFYLPTVRLRLFFVLFTVQLNHKFLLLTDYLL